MLPLNAEYELRLLNYLHKSIHHVLQGGILGERAQPEEVQAGANNLLKPPEKSNITYSAKPKSTGKNVIREVRGASSRYCGATTGKKVTRAGRGFAGKPSVSSLESVVEDTVPASLVLVPQPDQSLKSEASSSGK